MTNGLAPLWILVRAATAEAGSGRDISWRHETRIPYLAFNHQRIFGRFGVRIQTVRYMNERPIVSGTRISTWANGFGSRMHVLRSEAVHVMSYCRWYRTPRLTKILRYRWACEYRTGGDDSSYRTVRVLRARRVVNDHLVTPKTATMALPVELVDDLLTLWQLSICTPIVLAILAHVTATSTKMVERI